MTRLRLAVVLACSCACACREAGDRPGKGTPVPSPQNWSVRDPRDSRLLPVAEDDPCYEHVEASIAKLKEHSAQSKSVELVFRAPLEVKGDAAAKLFPHHRFFVFVWDQKVREPLPPNVAKPAGLAIGLHHSIAVDKQGRLTRFGVAPAFAAFGDFLAENAVKIRNARDARLVWDAFCEINRRERKGKIEKASDHLWRLGVTAMTWGGEGVGRYYLEVRLNADSTVRSARMESERPARSRVGR